MNAIRTMVRTQGVRASFASRSLSTSVSSPTSNSIPPPVMIDRVVASKQNSLSQPEPVNEQYRLPNDVNDRNAIYYDEDVRSMAGIEASVRHVSSIQDQGI